MSPQCVQCGFNNPPGMRFCGNCGARLEAAPAAPAPLVSPTSSEFGSLMGADLAERLRRAGLEAAGQRRNVTVLFADISGFTALSERIDGEDLYNLVQEYVRVLANAVYKYEGVVDKFTGDGLMALFGAPISHENNAERAVRASMDMQEDLHNLSKQLSASLGADLLVRIGLHSGSVIVGGIGANDLVLNYTAIGDTVNLAHRIEEATPPGSILISETVYRQVRAFFDCQQVTLLNPKGIAHPVVAYSVAGLRSRPGAVRGLEGLRAPMIGREYELTQLNQAAVDLLVSGRMQFALVTGDAGLGKSRLVSEFRSSLDVSRLRVYEGQSLAYRRVSYWLIRDVLYSLLDVQPTTPPAEVRGRLEEVVAEHMGSEAAEMIPYLESILGLSPSDPSAAERFQRMDPGQLRQQIFLTVHDLFLQESYRNPMVLILEDLHWADEASLELLAFLLDLLRNRPVFFLAISRSVQSGALEKAVIWAGQNLGVRFRHIQLQSLSREQSKQLLNLLLSIPNLPDRLREQILLRAAGIPFYLEEILRMLIDQGVLQNMDGRWQVMSTTQLASLGVPDTLQELILTRFDRLVPAQRKVLQVAAVIGKDFSLPLLSAVLTDGERDTDLPILMDSLVEREFVQTVSPQSDSEFTFRHILMSDAIYSTLLRKERSSLHGRVAETIERIYADRLDDLTELLANHYRWSPHLDRAVHYLILAGKKASRNNVNQQARLHYETALELLYQIEYTPEQAFQVHSGLGDCLVFAGEYPEARGHYEWALQSLDATQARERSATQRNLARTFERQGDYDRALEHLTLAEQCLAAAGVQDPVELARVWNDTAWIKFRRGGVSEAEELLGRALELVEVASSDEVVASIYNRLGGMSYNRGDWEQAARFLRKSIAIREEARDVVNLSTSFNNLGLLEIEMGHFDSALENLSRSYELKQRLGQAEGIAMALNNLGWLRILRGELDEARRVLQQALDRVQQIGYSSLHQQIMRSFGELYLAAQDWGAALMLLNENLHVLESQGESDELVDCYRQLGEASLGAGDLMKALTWAQKAGDMLEATQKGLRGRAAIQRGEFLLFRGALTTRLGDLEAAKTYLNQSEKLFEDLNSRLHQARVQFALGALALAEGSPSAAGQRFAQAAEIFGNIGATLDAERARQAAAAHSHTVQD